MLHFQKKYKKLSLGQYPSKRHTFVANLPLKEYIDTLKVHITT